MSRSNCALFLDYDNVRYELERYDPAVAARFSNRPLLWLQALEAQLVEQSGDSITRNIVSRRCYASPHMINTYRRNFVQTGFEVIDCPPLTTQMKNSADIYIVMDVVDYLGRYPHIDEYIILSADADFVPVLNRLRKELKRSVIYASYNTTSAYRNCSDQRIEAEFFADALAVTQAPTIEEPLQPAPEPVPFSDEIEACLRAAAARRFGRAVFAAAGHALRDGLPARIGSNWAGYRTFSNLLHHCTFERLQIDWDAQVIVDPDYEFSLPGWSAQELEQLGAFAQHVASTASKYVPIYPPACYRLIFDRLAAYYQGTPETFSDAVEAVTDACIAAGFDVKLGEVRFVATGISMQGYRYDAEATAPLLASLWRRQIFYLCGEADWLREPESALQLATWLHAGDETPEDARDDFRARTADAVDDLSSAA